MTDDREAMALLFAAVLILLLGWAGWVIWVWFEKRGL